MVIRPGAPPVVEIFGEIDIQSAPRLREELLRVVRRHGSRLALDLGGVTFLDCAGINALLATRRRTRLEDGWVRVIRASPCARRIISLLGLAEVFALSALVLAIIAGFFEIFAAFRGRQTAGTRALFILGGLVSIAFGVVLFSRPGVGAVTLALLFGLFSLIYGISQITLGIQLR